MDKVSDQVKEDWTSFQYASNLIQVCGKLFHATSSGLQRSIVKTIPHFDNNFKQNFLSLCEGDLLLRIQEFKSSVLKAVTTSSQKWLESDHKDSKTVAELFNSYNYLQKESPLEFGSLVEFIHNIENGW